MRVLILGAGFGGLELATMLPDADKGGAFHVTLLDKSDALVRVHVRPDDARCRPAPLLCDRKSPARFLQETNTAIDPHPRRVTTNASIYDADNRTHDRRGLPKPRAHVRFMPEPLLTVEPLRRRR